MKTYRVQLFAGARSAAGSDVIEVAIPDGATVANLREALVGRSPPLARFGDALWIAIDGEYAADADPLPATAEIACFPPVSGG